MMWLKKYLEDYFDEPVEVTKPKGRFGDYTSNILLKKKLPPKEVVDHLKKHDLIDHVEVVNGHMNIFLTTGWMNRTGKVSSKPYRAKVILNRLQTEGYSDGSIDAHWEALIKKVHELNYTLDVFGEPLDLDQEVIKTFLKLDHAYVYRGKSKELLGGISNLLNQMLNVLGRL